MELLTYRFSLDTHKNGVQRTLQGFNTGDNISRRLIISLVENEESYALPLDNIVAAMYVKRPSQTDPSINECVIDGNQIVYDVPASDLTEEGEVNYQLKVIYGTVENPLNVLVSPRFSVEVWESLTQDSSAESSEEYTALEAALIKAKMCYDARIVSFDIANDGTLTVVYGMVDDYRATKEYVADDKVFYNNTAWKCLQTCTGVSPEEGDYWTEISLDEAHITYTSDYFKDNITPSIEVGTVTEGDTMSVTNSGTALHAVFDFTLKKGDKGDDGYSPIANVAKVGDTATITITDENGTTTASISDGEDGIDGYSPTATVTKSGDTATITITDKNGTTTETISDGQDGQDGQDGADGYSPTATVIKSGDTATITITDKNGTTTAQVSDGTGTTTVWNQIQQSGSKIAEITINGSKTDVYSSPIVDNLSSTSTTSALSANQGKALADGKADRTDLQNYYTKAEIDSQEEPLAKNGGSKTWNELITNSSTYLVAANANKFYRLSTAGTVDTTNENLFVSGIVDGEHFAADSHIAVVEESTNVFKYDYFGGGIEPEVYFDVTATATTYTFTHNAIVADSAIFVLSSIVGDECTNIAVDGSTHTCTVTMETSQSRTVRILVK